MGFDLLGFLTWLSLGVLVVGGCAAHGGHVVRG